MLVYNARLLLVFPLVGILLTASTAAEPKPNVPDDPDVAIQGEYVGYIKSAGTREKIGVQVIAQGKGKFRAVAFFGGLPGDELDKRRTFKLEGETGTDGTVLTAGQKVARISGGKMKLMAGRGAEAMLERVERRSPTLGAKPPDGAVVLFDGKNADQFAGGKITEEGLLRPGATSKLKFQSGTLHVEFQIPYGPLIASRGNSGVYLQSRYEVQILDSFGFKPHNHECGGIPSVREPDLTMSFPPLSWQTYDVEFTAAMFVDGKKEKPARMTVRHNGVTIHDNVEVPHATTSSPLPEGPEPGPLNLQEHGSEVRFRNIWFLPEKA